MERLTSYHFKKPSTSRYAPVVKALIEEKDVFAVRLMRGEDFGQDVTLDSVQGAVSQQVRNAGRRARTFRESDDVLVVALWPEGEGPKKPRKQRATAARA